MTATIGPVGRGPSAGQPDPFAGVLEAVIVVEVVAFFGLVVAWVVLALAA